MSVWAQERIQEAAPLTLLLAPLSLLFPAPCGIGVQNHMVLPTVIDRKVFGFAMVFSAGAVA